MKRIVKEKENDNNRNDYYSRRTIKKNGSVITEEDEETYDLVLRKEKLNVEWKKYSVFNYFNVERCFKC